MINEDYFEQFYLEETLKIDILQAFAMEEEYPEFIQNIIDRIRKIIICGINIGIRLDEVYNLNKNYLRKYLDFDNEIEKQKIIEEYRDVIESYYIKLKKHDYDYFINRYNTIEEFVLKDPFVKADREYSLIYILKNLKEKEEFLDSDFTNYIYKIYDMAYKYMLKSFIINKESKLYDYFISNEHDFWYINEFIKQDIENIKSSLNIVFNQNKLMNVIDNKNNSNHLMHKDIIKELSICENLDLYKQTCNLEFERFYNKFNDIHQKMALRFGWYGILYKEFMTKKKFNELKNEYLKLKRDYEDFINDKEFLKDIKEDEINNIKSFCLKANLTLENYYN